MRLEDASAGRRTFSPIHLCFTLMWMPCFHAPAVVCHFNQKYEWTCTSWYDVKSFPRGAAPNLSFTVRK